METLPAKPDADQLPALAPAPCSSLKAAVSHVLQSALDGSDESLRYEGRYIRWGLVEERIHALIDAASQATNDKDLARRALDSK